jgi:hypothetical protein
MKQFTASDVHRPESAFPRIYCDTSQLAHCPLDWQKRGLSQTASGYGSKLTSSFKISYEGKLYRLYTICFSNSGSTYFTVKGRKIYVS